MITKTEILYAFSRLQEQDDLPENVNEFMRDAALAKLAGEELKEGGGMKTKDEIIEAYKKILEIAGVPQPIIDNPTFINIEQPTDQDKQWAMALIEKYQSGDVMVSDEYAAQFAGTREIQELKKVLRTAKTALQNCMEVQAGNGKTLQDNAILLINNILEI